MRIAATFTKASWKIDFYENNSINQKYQVINFIMNGTKLVFHVINFECCRDVTCNVSTAVSWFDDPSKLMTWPTNASCHKFW